MNLSSFLEWSEEFIISGTLPWMHVLLIFTVCAAVCVCLRSCSLYAFLLSEKACSVKIGLKGCAAFLSGLAVCAFAQYVSFYMLPRTPQVFGDEIAFWSLGSGLSEYGRYVSFLKEANLESMFPIPPACSYILSLAFSLGGFAEKPIFVCAFLFSSAALALAFLWAFMYWKKAVPASAFICMLAFLPVHVRLSGCSALENGTLALLFAFMLLWELPCFFESSINYKELKSEKTASEKIQGLKNACLYCASCIGAWMFCWRMENGPVLIPLCLAVYFLHDKKRLSVFKNKHFYLACALGLIFSLPGILCNLVGIFKGYYLFYKAPEALAAEVKSNAVYNWIYWADNKIFPVFVSAFALLGLIKADKKKLVWLGAWIALTAFYCCIPSADFSLISHLDSWRNASFPSVFLIAAAACFCGELNYYLKNASEILICLFTAALCCSQLFSHWNFVSGRNYHIAEYLFFKGQKNSAYLENRDLFYDIDSDIPYAPINTAVEYSLTSGFRWTEMVWDKNTDTQAEPPVLIYALRDMCLKDRKPIIYRSFLKNTMSGRSYQKFYDDNFKYRKAAEVYPSGSRMCRDFVIIEDLTPKAREWAERWRPQ